MAVDIRRILQGGPNIEKLIAAGVIQDATLVHKFGRAPEIPTTTWGTVWDGATDYPYKYTNLVSPTIQSAAVGDTQEIVIAGVDEDFRYVQTKYTLNGTTPVPITEDIMLPFRMKNVSNVDLAGDVSLQAEGVTYAIIRDGLNDYNQTQMAIFAIPAGYFGIVSKLGLSIASGKEAEVNYRAKPFGEVWKTKRPLDLTSQTVPENVDYFFTEKTILDVRAKPTLKASVSAWFDITLIRKERFEELYGEASRYGLGVE